MGKRILFIDDESELVEDLPVVLKEEGFEVVATTDVAEAIKLFKESEFDIVLTDIAMPPSPDMDAREVEYGRETGVAIAAKIHRLKPSVHIVALTVIRDPEIVTRMRQAGIQEILNKPVEVEAIIEVLRRVTIDGK